VKATELASAANKSGPGEAIVSPVTAVATPVSARVASATLTGKAANAAEVQLYL
jgi:hypothetical protein